MTENLTQCSVCRTLIPPDKAAGMTPPLLCDGCRARQVTAKSSEFPFATFIRFRAAVKTVATMLLVVAIVQFVAVLWIPFTYEYFEIDGLSSSYQFWNIIWKLIPSTILWNILLPILLLMIRKALLAFSEMMSDMFIAAHREKL
jgi:hypothetical protein